MCPLPQNIAIKKKRPSRADFAYGSMVSHDALTGNQNEIEIITVLHNTDLERLKIGT